MTDQHSALESGRTTDNVTRRRFMQATALGGAATLVVNSAAGASHCSLIGDFKGHDNCKRTMEFICDYKMPGLFTDPFHKVLHAALPKVSQPDWDIAEPLYRELVKFPACTLRSLFVDDPVLWPGWVGRECHKIRHKFAFPFMDLRTPQRDEIEKFLDSKAGRDGKEIAMDGFLKRFNGKTLNDIYTALHKNTDRWDLYLIQRAKQLGILKFHSSVRAYSTRLWPKGALQKEHCATYTGGKWQCVPSTDEDDLCGIDTNGDLEAGSDLCP